LKIPKRSPIKILKQFSTNWLSCTIINVVEYFNLLQNEEAFMRGLSYVIAQFSMIISEAVMGEINISQWGPGWVKKSDLILCTNAKNLHPYQI
jgi:hypothetical protein